MDRLDYNRKILEIISEITEMYPDLRFHQVLSLLNMEKIPDRFYEESEVTYKLLVEVVAKLRERKLTATLNRLLERTS